MKDEFANLNDYDSILAAPIGSRVKSGGVYAILGKRIFDLSFAMTALIIFSPLVAVLWLLVRLDGGPGFFGHKRVGLQGREFACWKLRTMTPDAEQALNAYLLANPAAAKEWAATMKLKNDPRITRIGRFLRRSRLDELPQFWNVLIGDMSVVGPRPVTRIEILRYGSAASLVLSQRPGVTGPWQVSGGASELYDQRIDLDKQYVRNISFGLDVAVVVKTVLTVFRMNGH
jgi:lipopolysaccharide/colanic/teichoic acid biosynthesis glycosyltransferase